jgi:hypothetical protein
MNIENVKKLIEVGPSLYGDTFWFECGDGWFNILLQASIELEKQIQTYPKDERENIVALQVKEKYGTLRFYVSYYTEDLDEIIQRVEQQSACTCETCGAPGKLHGTVWLYTACDEHTRDADKLDKTKSSGAL